MNKDYGFGGNEENSAPKAENNSGYERPVTPPTGYGPNYNPQYTYNSQANQYMPYGSYNYANNNQQPQKKKSKGKRKGCLISVLILVVVFFLAVSVLISSFFSGTKKQEPSVQNGEDTTMNIVETPKDKISAEDVESAGDVYNVAYGGREYLIDIYYGLTKALGLDIEPNFGPDRAGDIKHSNADIGKAKELLA